MTVLQDRWQGSFRIGLGLLLISLGLLGLGATGQLLRARWQGTIAGFPPPIPWSGEPRVGLNVPLFGRRPEERRRDLEQIQALGIPRIRVFFPWSAIQPEKDRWDWTEADQVMAEVRAAGLELVAVLGDSPGWAARRRGPMAPPLDPADFARFAGAFAARYGRWVRFYQIWDEPNLTLGWGGGLPDPPAYVAMLQQAAVAIRAADPDAVIVLAGLAPTVERGPWNLADWLFLEQLYQLGAREFFDIVAAKPYGFDTGPDDRRVDPEVLNFSRAILLREVMVRYGDERKPIWASHWGWNALPPGWSGRPSIWGQVDEATQARYIQEAIARVRREWPWMGTMFLETWRPETSPDDPRWGFALVDPSGRLRPAAEALRAAVSSAPFTPGYYPASVPQEGAEGRAYGPPPGAIYEGAWRFSALGADIGREEGDRLSFVFEGTGLALRVRRGGYRAHLYVWVDGQPANRLPRVLWSGWVETARVQATYGIRMNLDFYHVGPMFRKADGEWVFGYFTGSGLPMRFVDEEGRVLDIYQQLTALVDEQLIGWTWPQAPRFPVSTALDISRALIRNAVEQSEALALQAHVDPFAIGGEAAETQARWLEGVLDETAGRGIPIWSAQRWLEFVEARERTELEALRWDPESRTLHLRVTAPPVPSRLTMALPLEVPGGRLSEVQIHGVSVPHSEWSWQGFPYAWIPLPSGILQISVRYA